MKTRRRLRVGVGCAALFLLATAGTAQAQRKVFAHYMLANQDYVADDAVADPDGERTIASYEREIRQAEAIGIDGFALNAGGWSREPRYIRRASEMFEAALRVDDGFRLMFSADMCCSNSAGDVEDMMRRFAGNPRYARVYFRHEGKFVLTTFAGEKYGPGFWAKVRADLESGAKASTLTAPEALKDARGVASSAAMKVELVTAFFWGGETPNANQVAEGLTPYMPVIDGALYWGIAGVPGGLPDPIASSEAYAKVLHGAGKLYMAPVAFQFWGANAGRYFEYSGYEGMRRMWMDAIRASKPDWVEILTWNDFIEGTYVSPIDDPAQNAGANDLGASVAPVGTLHFFPSHAGAYELTRYFASWYRSGVEPAITSDEVFWAYRPQMLSASHDAGIRMYGPPKDAVYVTANLKAAAELRVYLGERRQVVKLRAGSQDVEVPMVAGAAPRFELWRAGVKLAEASGEDAVAASARWPQLYNSTGWMHD